MLIKLWLTHATNDSKSFVIITVRFRYTTSRSNSFSLVNYHSARNEETILTKDSKHIYHRLLSLRKEKNNIFVLLIWSFTYHDQILEVLSDWIKSKESSNLCQRLIEDLWLQQTFEEFALTLIALLCRERLLLNVVNDIAQLIKNSYLIDLNAILNN